MNYIKIDPIVFDHPTETYSSGIDGSDGYHTNFIQISPISSDACCQTSSFMVNYYNHEYLSTDYRSAHSDYYNTEYRVKIQKVPEYFTGYGDEIYSKKVKLIAKIGFDVIENNETGERISIQHGSPVDLNKFRHISLATGCYYTVVDPVVKRNLLTKTSTACNINIQ